MIKRTNLAKSLLAFAVLFSTKTACPWWGNNAGLPYDSYQKQSSPCRQRIDWSEEDKKYKVSLGASTEVLFDGHGRDKNGIKVGQYQIYSQKDGSNNRVEPYGSFFETASVVDPEIEFAERFHGLTNQDFGDVIIKGKRTEGHLTLWGSLAFPIKKIQGTIRLSSYLPLKSINLSQLSLSSVNANSVNSGMLDLSEPGIARSLEKIGSLKSKRLSNTNVLGDLFLMLSWHNVFEQENETVRKIGLMVQAGVSLPTSNATDYNNIYSVPNGADGAIGLPISGSADVYIKDNFRVFAGVDVYPIFNDSHNRRVKKSENQGDILIPTAIKVERDGGTFFRATTLFEVTSNNKMFWGGLGYQYGKKHNDTISMNNNNYSSTIINKAERLKEADFHNILGFAGLNLTDYFENLAPCLNLHVRYPLKGQRISLFKVIGLELVVNI